MKTITKEWLERAKDDLDAIAKLVDEAHLTNITAKAVVEEFGLSFAKTHKLEFLLGLISPKLSFDVDLTLLKRLDDVYIESRYPSDLGVLPYGKPTRDDAGEFHAFAKDIYAKINVLLNRCP